MHQINLYKQKSCGENITNGNINIGNTIKQISCKKKEKIMIENKKTYISGLLAIILLASHSPGRASSYLSSGWEAVKSGAGSAYNTAKSLAPYAPAAALTGAAALGAQNGNFWDFNIPLGLAMLSAAAARSYKASQEEGGGFNPNYNFSFSNLAPYAIPALAATAGAANKGYFPEVALNSAAVAPLAFGASKIREWSHRRTFENIKNQIKDLVYKILDKELTDDPSNDKDAYLFINNDLLKLILDYNAYFPYVSANYGTLAAKLKDAREFIKQVAIKYGMEHQEKDRNKISQQIEPLKITAEDVKLFNALEPIQGLNEPVSPAESSDINPESSSSGS